VVAILISGKVDFKLKLVRREKKGHSLLIKGIIYQKEITLVNLHVPSIGAPNFITQTLLDLKVQMISKQ
jgi:hypothetical protein